jgi:hypothetical protein
MEWVTLVLAVYGAALSTFVAYRKRRRRLLVTADFGAARLGKARRHGFFVVSVANVGERAATVQEIGWLISPDTSCTYEIWRQSKGNDLPVQVEADEEVRIVFDFDLAAKAIAEAGAYALDVHVIGVKAPWRVEISERRVSTPGITSSGSKTTSRSAPPRRVNSPRRVSSMSRTTNGSYERLRGIVPGSPVLALAPRLSNLATGIPAATWLACSASRSTLPLPRRLSPELQRDHSQRATPESVPVRHQPVPSNRRPCPGRWSRSARATGLASRSSISLIRAVSRPFSAYRSIRLAISARSRPSSSGVSGVIVSKYPGWANMRANPLDATTG